jgi:K+/H+ antiporter YhaU regulatory subunit KhtT
MSLWNRIKHGIEHGTPTVFEKAATWLKSGAEIAEAGAERLSSRVIYASRLSKLRSEQRDIRKAIEEQFSIVGETTYDLWRENEQADLAKRTRAPLGELRSLEKQLETKGAEIEELMEKFHMEPIDRQSLKELKDDLEAGGGTVEQVTIEDGSPLMGKRLRDTKFPTDVLVGTIMRNGEILIPDGDTAFHAGDRVALLGKREDVERTIEQLKSAQ